ncbi:MAG TPA: UDP-glucose 4-epimerase GalE [Candidatus Polarisedimenticolia bacterium]|jgi:UDP-glucose 4-epimerase
MRILVTGGAGYIGSHVVRHLKGAGHEPIVLDDLKEGHRAAVEGVRLIQADIADRGAVESAFGAGPLDGVIHMAASCLVGESMQDPARYYDNNVNRTLRFLDMLAEGGVRRIVFSSTAAVYGDPLAAAGARSPVPVITEEHPTAPTNVYGETKLVIERALGWLCARAGWRAISLRYFNAAGADPSGAIGEDHAPETHLIPLVMKAALGIIPHVTVQGRDYPTPDGTCLRDYIHVHDLASAHLLALEALSGGTGFAVYNLGAEKAVSVLELIEEARRVTGRPIPTLDGPRRPGDPAVLLASSDRIKRQLGWRPAHSDLATILSTAWTWHSTHPLGYK